MYIYIYIYIFILIYIHIMNRDFSRAPNILPLYSPMSTLTWSHYQYNIDCCSYTIRDRTGAAGPMQSVAALWDCLRLTVFFVVAGVGTRYQKSQCI